MTFRSFRKSRQNRPTNQPTDGHEGSCHREVTLPISNIDPDRSHLDGLVVVSKKGVQPSNKMIKITEYTDTSLNQKLGKNGHQEGAKKNCVRILHPLPGPSDRLQKMCTFCGDQ